MDNSLLNTFDGILLRTVRASGPLHADILLIAEAPGATEEFGIPPNVSPQPLIGKSGLFMQQMCAQAGLTWSLIRKDNVVQRRPFPDSNEFKLAFYTKQNPLSKAKNSKLIPTDELLAWREDLHHRVLKTKPKIIIAAGGEALQALTLWSSDTQWRGSVIEYQSPLNADFHCYLIPIVHPSFAQKCYHNTSSKVKEVRQPWFNITVIDLKKARHILQQGWNPRPRTEHIFPTFQETMTYLEELKQLPPGTLITLDIETQGKFTSSGEENNDTRIGCLGLTHNSSSAFCIPFIRDSWSSAYFSMDEETQVLQAIQLALKGKHLVGQFIGFDVAWLDREFPEHLNLFDDVYIDTAVLHSLLFPELHHTLAFLVSTLTDLPYYKYLGRQDEKVRSFEEWFSYNCQDVYSTHEIAELLIKEAKRTGMWDYYINKTLPILKWTFYQHKRGLWVDEEAKECLLEVFMNETLLPMQQALDGALEEVGYGAINPRSWQQVLALLKDMGFTVESTDKEALKELINLTGSKTVETLLELKQGYHAASRLAKPVHKDGQYRTALSMHVTETGRLASRSSHFGGGDNLQNVNKNLRPIFRARPGYMLIEADLSAAEARMVAWYAGDPGLKEAFIKGLDVHTHRSAMIHEVNYEDLLIRVQNEEPEAKRMRQCGKVCVHAVGYDIGVRTLRKTLIIHGVQMRELEVKHLRRRIHARFPGILYYQQGVQQKLNKTRTLTTARGRRRYFFSKLDPNTYKRGYAYLPQATVGEVVNDGIVSLLKNEEFIYFKAAILLQVHDSLLIEVPEEFAIPCLHLVKDALETPTLITPFHGLADVLTVPVDLKLGTNWGALEKITL
jgi:DNA polymerase I-like protein with 3'-5' exonuclease and polymerase domains/uracil-DNA glycosylase